MSKIVTTDYYGNKYQADPEDMKVTVHVYGIAVGFDLAAV